jgi:mitochondrial fission protein ELM1
MGHLAWADAFVITADSVSMLSEACSTGYVQSMMMRINLSKIVC